MQTKQEPVSFSVVLNEANLSAKAPRGYICGTGSIIDDVAYALGFWTWEDAEMNNDHYFSEIVDNVIKGYDWGAYVRDLLNKGISWKEAEELLAEVFGSEDRAIELCARADGSEYLLGDFLDIECPDDFNALVRYMRAEATESIKESFPFNEDAEAPQDLKNELQSEIDSAHDYLRREWLEGDRSTLGALDYISKHLTGERGNVAADEENMTVDFTLEQAQDFLGYDYDDTQKITETLLLENVVGHLLHKFQERDEKKTHSQERAREQQAKKVEAARIALEAKKEAARKRKQSQ